MILSVTLNPAVDLTFHGGPLAVGQTNRIEDAMIDPGGKGNTAARIAHLLGSDVAVTGFLGGFTGEYIRRAIGSEGILADFYPIKNATRFTVAYVNGSEKETKLVPHGHGIGPDEAEGFLDHFDRMLSELSPTITSLSGSLPPRLSPDYYARLIQIASKRGVPVVLDSSGAALREGIPGGPFMIKPNSDEAYELSGTSRTKDLFAYMHALTANVGIVALTLGGKGALFFSKDKNYRAFCPVVGAVSSVGAGDAFVGGFLSAFDFFGADDVRNIRWAVAAGTCTALSPAYLWPRSTFDEIEASVVVDDFTDKDMAKFEDVQ